MSRSNEQLIQSFKDYLNYEKRYSLNTVLAYQTDLLDFFKYTRDHYGEVAVADIEHSQVRSWLASLKSKKIGSRSINRKISTLKSFFKYQLKTGSVRKTPMAKVISPKSGKRLPVFVKEADTKALVESLSRSAEDWKSYNARMLITIFYSTGMRLNELISLKEKQIDFGKSQIKVLGKGNKERIIPVNKKVIELIRAYQDQKKKTFSANDDFLLITEKGRKLYPKYAYLLVNHYLGQASSIDKKSPHVLRHTFATHLMNNGADLNAVKELLGHSSLAATQVYTHNSIEKLKSVYKKAHPKA